VHMDKTLVENNSNQLSRCFGAGSSMLVPVCGQGRTAQPLVYAQTSVGAASTMPHISHRYHQLAPPFSFSTPATVNSLNPVTRPIFTSTKHICLTQPPSCVRLYVFAPCCRFAAARLDPAFSGSTKHSGTTANEPLRAIGSPPDRSMRKCTLESSRWDDC
jgi:hypothetical protein